MHHLEVYNKFRAVFVLYSFENIDKVLPKGREMWMNCNSPMLDMLVVEWARIRGNVSVQPKGIRKVGWVVWLDGCLENERGMMMEWKKNLLGIG